MAARTSGEGAYQTAQGGYYDVSAEQSDITQVPTSKNVNSIPPEPHGPTDKSGSKGDNVVVDVEKGGVSPAPTQSETSEEEKPKSRSSMFYRKYRPFIHGAIWLLFTGWWIASLVLHRPGTENPKNWVVPFLLWLAITLRIVTLWIPVSLFFNPVRWTWRNTVSRGVSMIPEKFRTLLGAAGTVGVILLGTFVPESQGDNSRANRAISCLGLVVLIFGMWITSRNRKAVNWHTIIMGMLVQYIIALFVLQTEVGYDIFNFISTLARELLGFAKDGVAFLTDDEVPQLPWFLISVVPAIIFFVALVNMLYYVGLIQWFVGKFAVFFFWSMRVSGAEAVVAAATPFIGQGESAMLIKPFVPYLTKAEIHQVMACGFATIAGSVLVAYIGLGLNPQVLVSSCIMSIPASLALSHLRYPEEEETLTAGKIVVPKEDEECANVLEALAKGAWLGIKIGGMIIATLLCIIALLNLVSGLLTWWGRYLNLNGEYDLTVELIVGYIFYPVAFLLGVPRGPDLLKVARLIGVKVVANEYVAFAMLTDPDSVYFVMSDRAKLIATYSVCGFGNIGSLGTQLGVLSQIAPSRTGDVASVAVSALVTGVLSTLSSAAIAGMLIQDEAGFIAAQ